MFWLHEKQFLANINKYALSPTIPTAPLSTETIIIIVISLTMFINVKQRMEKINEKLSFEIVVLTLAPGLAYFTCIE